MVKPWRQLWLTSSNTENNLSHSFIIFIFYLFIIKSIRTSYLILSNVGRRDVGFFMRLKLADRLLIVFFGGIIAGSIVVNLIPFSWVQAMNVWSAEYITAFMSKTIRFTSMFNYLLKLRGRIMGGLFIIMLTPFISKLVYILPAYIGAAWGMVSSIIMMEHGVNGLRICFFLVFPHFIFYTLGIGMTAYKLLRLRSTQSRKPDISLICVILFAVLAIAAGIMCEAYINTAVFAKLL